MATRVSSKPYIPLEFPAQGNIRIRNDQGQLLVTNQQCFELFQISVRKARIAAEDGENSWKGKQLICKSNEIDPEQDVVLRFGKKGKEEPIGAFSMRALDGETIKPELSATIELIQKVEQHMQAKKTEGILLSPEGNKFDTRWVTQHKLEINQEDFLTVNGKKILHEDRNVQSFIKSSWLSSYTITRCMQDKKGDQDIIRLFDEYSIACNDPRETYIVLSEEHSGKNQEPSYPFKQETLSKESKVALSSLWANISMP